MSVSKFLAIVLAGAALVFLLISCREPQPWWVPRASDAGVTSIAPRRLSESRLRDSAKTRLVFARGITWQTGSALLQL